MYSRGKKCGLMHISSLYVQRAIGFMTIQESILQKVLVIGALSEKWQLTSLRRIVEKRRTNMAICVPDEPGDSPEWSRKYEVFSISRLYLRSIGFSTEQINTLSDEDMQRIADTYSNRNFISFEEDIKFLVACEIAEKHGGDHD